MDNYFLAKLILAIILGAIVGAIVGPIVFFLTGSHTVSTIACMIAGVTVGHYCSE